MEGKPAQVEGAFRTETEQIRPLAEWRGNEVIAADRVTVQVL